MSIFSELTRIKEAKISIKTAINTKGGNITDEKLDQYSAFIINLPTGGSEFYKCASVNTSTKTWSGYKAVLTDGVYSFEETVSQDLEYTAVTPKIGTVYSEDALGEVKLWTGAGNIPAGVPTDGLLAWYPLTVNANDAFGGRSDSIINGNVDFSKGYATGFSTSNYIQLPGGIIPNGQNEWTVGFVIKKPERTWCHDVAEVKGSNEGVAFHDTGGWYHIQQWDSEWTAVNEQPFDKWLLLLIANKPSTGYMVVYTNGSETRATDAREISINNPITVGALNRNGTMENATPSVTQIKHIFFYGKALSSDEVSNMYQAMSNAGEFSDSPNSELPDDYLTVNGTEIYKKVNTGENNQDNYPIKFVKWVSDNQGILGGGSFVFNTTENRWQRIGDLNPDDPANLMYQAKTTGVNGLTGEWEAVNGEGSITVEYNGTLPEWNGTPDTGDKAYLYTVSGAGIAEANGDYYDSGKVKEFSDGNSSKVYENENGWELYYDYDMWFWALSSEAFTTTMGIAYSGSGDSSAPPTGTYSDFNAGDGTSPIVSEYVGGTEGPTKEYEITVTDATGEHAGANGNYWRIDPPANMWSGYNTTDYGVWTNGTYYIAYCPQYWMGWTLVNNLELDPSSGTDIRAAYVMSAEAPAGSTPAISGWSDVTVTLYSGNKEYKYTVSGFTGGKSAANGDYWQIEPTGIHSVYRTDLGLYTNGTYYLAYCNNYWNGWCLVTDFTVDPAPMDGSDALIAPGPDGDSPVTTWAAVGATVAEYVG